ncbi:MAG: hypothetical protein COX62_06055 [Deltaproteobacteria bacterium CG_4_10_14_0_2_um_filter_43_8]|nr:MAG: hypothetical protein COX62_06055 [Deltaproteobacteria bacterium CG_4_10_14_0_2_um_filter_43_8]
MLCNYTGWLCQSYLNLSQVPANAPFHAFAPLIAYDNLFAEKTLPLIQSVLPQTFRRDLFVAAGFGEYISDDPLRIPKTWHTLQWEALQNAVSSYSILERPQQSLLLQLLSKLCLYDVAYQLGSATDHAQPIVASYEIMYWTSMAQHSLWGANAIEDFSFDPFMQIYERAPRDSLIALHASYQMIIANIKHAHNVEVADQWCKRHWEILDTDRLQINSVDRLRFLSRYYRVYGFIPQMRNDRDAVHAVMEQAEHYARELIVHVEHEFADDPDFDFYHIAAKEMLHPVLESRTKEALWLGDLDMALAKSMELVALCPNDPRLHLHLGQVQIERREIEAAAASYLRAFAIGQPGQAVAAFMHAQCLEHLGRSQDAVVFYMLALRSDPQGLSTVEKLRANIDIGAQIVPQFSEYIDEYNTANRNVQCGNAVQQYQHRQLNTTAQKDECHK